MTSTKRLITFLFLVFFALSGGLLACNDVDDDDDNDESAEQTVTSEEGHFVALVMPDPDPPRVGEGEALIVLTEETADGDPVTGATVEVTPWMPGHGHGSTETPEVTEIGDGEYSVTNIVYTMPGHWELLIDIDDDGVEDRAVANFDVQ